MNELETALYGRLSGDATLTSLGVTGVHTGFAPEDAVEPYILMRPRLSEGRDVYTMGGRAYSHLPYQIEAIDRGRDQLRAGRIGDRIDVLVTDHALSVSGHTTLYARRRVRIREPEIEGDITFRRDGGIFDFWEA